MGAGDEIMALGRIEALFNATGRRHGIRDSAGRPREHELWRLSPAWEKHAPDFITDCPGARPYIKDFVCQKTTGQRIIFNLSHRARAGKIWLSDMERAFCNIDHEFAVISPLIKDNASPNKQWGIERWEQAIVNFPLPVYQLGAVGTQIIKGARHFVTPTMRLAASVIDRASVVMANEGGIHHLAAAMDRPAVVVFGAFISPAVTGYSQHVNLAVETPEGFCGSYGDCAHCKNAMATITPDMVKEKAVALL